MTKKFTDESWQNLVPDVYRWVDGVHFETGNDANFQGVIVVPVRAKNDDKGVLQRELLCGASLPKDVQDALARAWASSAWVAKSGVLTLALVNNVRALLVPVSQIQTTSVQISRQFGIDLAKALKDYPQTELTIVADTSFGPASIFDGIGLGLYDIGIFKGARTAQALEALPKKVFIVGEKLSSHALKSIKQLVKASALTRMLQDAPANWLTPERFATIAADVSKELSLKCTILGRAELEALGAGSFLSVGAGSSGEPRLIAIEIPGVNSSETVALIGKGLTFDTGGNSLKPALGMGEMKYDMSGGAAVLGAACYLAKEKPRCRVICLIGAVENMPGPTATRPGDVVVAMNGKTIDVQNTDAEGRLVLADLLHYANVHYKPTLMVDIATLTGAVLHALGHAGAGLMSNDQSTADRVVRVAKEQGEPFWQLPLWPELEKETKGECSDLQNIAKPNVLAGTIMGGMFLAEFVGQTKWVHLDIAGTGWSCKATGFPSVGGSSFGLRTLAALCL